LSRLPILTIRKTSWERQRVLRTSLRTIGYPCAGSFRLTTDMEIWTPADTKLDAGGHQTWTLAATKSGHPRLLR
jgi:hypothetical protein